VIEFRNTSVGRQPFVKQTGMAVWEFIMVAQGFGQDAEHTAAYLQCPIGNVNVALNYYSAHREEIDQILEENDIGEERLKQLFPHLQVFTIPVLDEDRSFG
jgi:uncharacterized protein (DUF433 family)